MELADTICYVTAVVIIILGLPFVLLFLYFNYKARDIESRQENATSLNARSISSRRINAREPIPTAIKEQVIKRDRSTCRYCGRTVWGKNLHIDHIIPVSRGGHNGATNLVVACAKCNLSKGNKTAQEWRNSMKR
jgi:5-methylcytosine-specific restriction endonuclease McrA